VFRGAIWKKRDRLDQKQGGGKEDKTRKSLEAGTGGHKKAWCLRPRHARGALKKNEEADIWLSVRGEVLKQARCCQQPLNGRNGGDSLMQRETGATSTSSEARNLKKGGRFVSSGEGGRVISGTKSSL